jgi:hypothetical protein
MCLYLLGECPHARALQLRIYALHPPRFATSKRGRGSHSCLIAPHTIIPVCASDAWSEVLLRPAHGLSATFLTTTHDNRYLNSHAFSAFRLSIPSQSHYPRLQSSLPSVGIHRTPVCMHVIDLLLSTSLFEAQLSGRHHWTLHGRRLD